MREEGPPQFLPLRESSGRPEDVSAAAVLPLLLDSLCQLLRVAHHVGALGRKMFTIVFYLIVMG